MLANDFLPPSTQKLLDIIQQKGGEITARQLMRCSREHTNATVAFSALQQLVDDGKGEWYYPPTGVKGGKPSAVFRAVG